MQNEPVVQTPYLQLTEDRAPTLSGRSAVRYAVFADPARARVFLAIVANEGGGNWNKEAVALANLEAALANVPAGAPFATKILRAAITGRSTNNAGFIAAALVHAGLLAPAADAKHKLVKTGDWSGWAARMLALDGEEILFPPNAPGAPQAPEPPTAVSVAPEPSAKKTRRGGNRLIPVAGSSIDGEASDADPR